MSEPTSTQSPEHRPFRTWALQQDLISLIGADADWRAPTGEMGIESEPERAAEDVRGQSYLREILEPDPRYSVRTKTAIALWAAALVTDTLNQWGPTGIEMSSGAFTVTIVSVLAALIFTVIVYPRLAPKPFAVVEQAVLAFAYVLIAYQCADTGGSESPYIVWFVFTVFYAAYLLPERQAIANVVVALALGLSTAAMSETAGDTHTLLVLTTFCVVSILLAGTLLRQRRLESHVERTVRFLALADPLTGVANLRSFEQFSEQMQADGDNRYGLAMVDMNGLKGANAVFGHEVGDGMVVRLSRLLTQASEPKDQVFRIGGDEFAVVMPGGAERELVRWRERFDELVQEHNARIRGRLPQISAAIGTATRPEDGNSADDLLDVADRRMYDQKTPAVPPPYEIDGVVHDTAGQLLRAARFSNVPSRSIEPQDVLGHGAANWVIVGTLTLLTLLLPADAITPWAAVAVGLYGFLMAGLCVTTLRIGTRKPLLALIDASTILYGGMSLLATGGWESPIQLAMLIPVAYYAQYLHGRAAVFRVALIALVYAAAFWGSGDVSAAGESLFATITTALLVLTAVLQFSSRSLVDSLRIVRESATLDPLTRIPNLHAFRSDLADAIERSTPEEVHVRRPALAIADLDDFRSINTRAGHRGGDRVLLTAVQRLRAQMRADARIYRIGGDELAVLFQVDRLSDAKVAAERVRRALTFRSQMLPADDPRVSASVGFAVWHEPLTPETFVETVETALAQSKAERGASVSATTNVML